jgi:hypothetical protein
MVDGIKMFKRREYSDEVELGSGKVKLRAITNGMVNKATNAASVKGIFVSNNLFFMSMERSLTGWGARKLNRLSLDDGNTLRAKVQEILKKYKIVEEPVEVVREKQDEADIFSKSDVEWFEKTKRGIIDGGR